MAKTVSKPVGDNIAEDASKGEFFAIAPVGFEEAVKRLVAAGQACLPLVPPPTPAQIHNVLKRLQTAFEFATSVRLAAEHDWWEIRQTRGVASHRPPVERRAVNISQE